MIGQIYGHNITPAGTYPTEDTYEYTYYEVEMKSLIAGTVTHARKNGILGLQIAICQDIQKKQAELLKEHQSSQKRQAEKIKAEAKK